MQNVVEKDATILPFPSPLWNSSIATKVHVENLINTYGKEAVLLTLEVFFNLKEIPDRESQAG